MPSRYAPARNLYRPSSGWAHPYASRYRPRPGDARSNPGPSPRFRSPSSSARSSPSRRSLTRPVEAFLRHGGCPAGGTSSDEPAQMVACTIGDSSKELRGRRTARSSERKNGSATATIIPTIAHDAKGWTAM